MVTARVVRERFALRPVLFAMLTLGVLLLVTSPFYGYQRDELYFRLLDPAWGYVDQPPGTPVLAHLAIWAFGDTVIALRIVSMLFAVASIAVLALITREVGGSRFAQSITAWGFAGAAMTLTFGHVLLTATVDLLVWPAALLFILRALLRDDGRWWIAAGLVIGASTYNKLLIAVLLAGVAVGLAIFGPWKWFKSGWLWLALLIVAVVALPNVLYQALNGFPQFAVGSNMGASNGEQVRQQMWAYLILLVGPVLAIFWIVAIVQVFRRPEWRPIRFLVAVLVASIAFVFYAGTQFYYTDGILAVLVAIGAVSVAVWANTRVRRRILIAGLVLNAIGCALASIPLLPPGRFHRLHLDAVNTASADQVGWEEYVAQISDVAKSVHADAIIASNYGEAGALDRFGTGLPPVFSGHNALWSPGGPPDTVRTIVITSGQGRSVEPLFASCQSAGRLDNGYGVANEEQGQDILVCTGPIASWSELWPNFKHYN